MKKKKILEIILIWKADAVNRLQPFCQLCLAVQCAKVSGKEATRNSNVELITLEFAIFLRVSFQVNWEA